MKKQIEVEVRGKIDNFNKILEQFKKIAKFIEEKDRFSMIYFRDGVVSCVKDKLKDEKVDFKLRVTNKKAEIVLKYGLIKGSESRKEILIPIALEKIDEAADLFNILGWNKGLIMATKTFVFNYKDTEFAIVNSLKGNYFEAERVVHENDDAKKEMNEIKKICKELNLKLFSQEEFFDFLDSANQDRNLHFDLTKQKFSEIQEKYKEFF